MKLCKDCKHMRSQSLPEQSLMPLYSIGRIHVAACSKEIIKQGNTCLVTGAVTTPVYESCNHMRHSDKCGPEAMMFEPLPPKRWWEFWK